MTTITSKSTVLFPRPFTPFLAGLTISKLGDSLYAFAIPWIAYELTHSSVSMGSLFAVEILPVLFFGAVIGVYIDRWDRRKLLMLMDVGRMLVVISIPLLQTIGLLEIWYLYIAAFALSFMTLGFDVTTTAIMPEIAQGNLTRANARHQTVMQLASMLGPMVAGGLITFLGGFQTLWLDAFSFVGTLIVVMGMPALAQSQRNTGSFIQEMREGLQWLYHNSVISILSVQAAIGNFGFGMVSAIFMFYLRDTLQISAHLSGINYAMLGLGGFLGSLAIVPLSQKYRRGVLYPLILLFGMSGLLLMAGVRLWWTAGFGFGMVSACNVAWVVLSTSVRQEYIPEYLFGRVLSLSRMLSLAAMPIGAMIGGWLVVDHDPMWIFLIAAGCKTIEFGIARFSSISKL